MKVTLSRPRLRVVSRLVVVAALVGALLIVGSAPPAESAANPVLPGAGLWFNGSVDAIAVSGTTAYVGGSFTSAGPATGGFAAIDATSGEADPTWPDVVEGLESVASDGAGGWYLGGYFTAVGGVARAGLAHVLSDGSVDPDWDPGVNNSVRALVVSGATVYAGGFFTTIGGQTRNSVAALDATTGSVDPTWDPNADGPVVALAVSGTTVYAGGEFTNIGGQPRSNIAALNTTNGNADPTWNPGTDFEVNALAVSGTDLYAGGYFTNVGGQTRNHLAALDLTTGTPNGWDPNADSVVFGVAVSGATVYAGGFFSTIGGQARVGIAALNNTSGAADPSWDADSDGSVRALAVSGTTLYAGGEFTSMGGLPRNHIAALDTADGAADPTWDPNADYTVYALAATGTTVAAGGGFASIGGQTRNHIAAIDLTTGTLTAWNPDADNNVAALAVSGTTVYAGGLFTTIGGQSRSRIAALDTTTGNADPAWNPNANVTVNALAVSGTTVYAGGFFTTIGGQTRNRIAALDTTTGNADPAWNPNSNGGVNALAVSGSTVYAGGSFSSIGGQSRSRIAALDTTTGTADPAWNPDADSPVDALAVSGSTVYVGGTFSSIGGQTRNNIAALDATTGDADPAWNPDADSGVEALAVSGTTVYAGGAFTSIGGETRNRIAALNTTTGDADLSFDPDASASAGALAISAGGSVLLGGDFTSIGLRAAARFAVFDATVSGAPSGVTGTAGNGEVSLSWTAPANDGGSAITGYEVTVSPTTGVTGLTTRSAATTSLVFTGLTSGTPYMFTVVALNGVGTGTGTASSAVTPLALPDAPTGVTGTAGDGEVSLSWTAPASNGGSAITNYAVTVSPTTGVTGLTTRSAATTSLVFTGLTNDTAYTFTVAAISAVGTGPTASGSALTPTAPAAGGGGSRPSPNSTDATVRPGTNGRATVELSTSAGDAEVTVTGDNELTVEVEVVRDAERRPGFTLLRTSFELDASDVFERAEVCLPYSDDEVGDAGLDESELGLFHGNDDGTFSDVTTSVDNAANQACGSVSSFSPFAIGQSRTSRLAGGDRYATSVAASQASFDAGVPVVVLASGLSFADALSAGPAAAALGGPLLLTDPNELPDVVAAELDRLDPDRVIVVGGVNAVRESVVAAIDAPVERIGGVDRYATAAAVSVVAFPSAETVYIATGSSFADALSGGPLAASDRAPLLLTGRDTIPTSTARELARLSPARVVVLGGTSAVSSTVSALLGDDVERLAGVDRYATAAAIAAALNRDKVFIASGLDPADALGGATAVVSAGGALLLTERHSLPDATAAALEAIEPDEVTVIGGTGVVARAVEVSAAAYMAR